MDLKTTRFYDAIGELSPGNRDGNLTRVATYGARAGLSQTEIYDAIMQNAPGGTRPDAIAVRRAVENCYGVTTSPVTTTGLPFVRRETVAERLERRRRSLPEDLRSSVSLMVQKYSGAKSADLVRLSPSPIPNSPQGQAAAHILALGTDWRWKAWFGTISPKTGKRGLVADPVLVAQAIETRLCPKIPTHISLNPLTGAEGVTKEGKPSFDCEATVAALRFCLVEFDDMPLADQCALWVAVVTELKSEVPVVSIVYSGGKSLHGIVLCPPADLSRDEIADADRNAYAAAWDRLIRRFASSHNAAERMDLAPSKNVAVHTRIGGAWREDKGAYQYLLYLDENLAKRSLELF